MNNYSYKRLRNSAGRRTPMNRKKLFCLSGANSLHSDYIGSIEPDH